jgi:hypothetical protein
MGESTFQTWWELHVRVARGESLTAEESAFYGRKQKCQEPLSDSDTEQCCLARRFYRVSQVYVIL